MLQITLCGFLAVSGLVQLLSGDLGRNAWMWTITFGMAVWLAALALQLLVKNYPDIPVAGKQKKIFNWLFVINFFLLAFMFAYIINEYKALAKLASLVKKTVFALPGIAFVNISMLSIIAICQITVLCGLFVLRRRLYYNFCNKLSDLEHDR